MTDEPLPRCMVKFACKWTSAEGAECDATAVVNAFLGQPYHVHSGLRVAMKPQYLIRDNDTAAVAAAGAVIPEVTAAEVIQDAVIEEVRYGSPPGS